MDFDINNVITNIDKEKAMDSIGLTGVFANDMKTLKEAVAFDYKILQGTLKDFYDDRFVKNSGEFYTLFYPFSTAKNIYVDFVRNNFRYVENVYEPFEELKIINLGIHKSYFDINNTKEAKRLLHCLQSRLDAIKSNYLSVYSEKINDAKNNYLSIYNKKYEIEYMANYTGLGRNVLKMIDKPKVKNAVFVLYLEKIKQDLKDTLNDYYIIKKIYKSFNNLIYHNKESLWKRKLK